MDATEKRNKTGILLGNLSYIILCLMIPALFFTSILMDDFSLWLIIPLTAFLVAFIGKAIATDEAKKPTKTAADITLVVVALHFYLLFSPDFWRPSWNEERNKTANSAGLRAVEAQKIHFQKTGRYAGSLKQLLTVDRSLANDKGIIFGFLHGSSSGYTFYTEYHDTGKVFSFSSHPEQ